MRRENFRNLYQVFSLFVYVELNGNGYLCVSLWMYLLVGVALPPTKTPSCRPPWTYIHVAGGAQSGNAFHFIIASCSVHITLLQPVHEALVLFCILVGAHAVVGAAGFRYQHASGLSSGDYRYHPVLRLAEHYLSLRLARWWVTAHTYQALLYHTIQFPFLSLQISSWFSDSHTLYTRLVCLPIWLLCVSISFHLTFICHKQIRRQSGGSGFK